MYAICYINKVNNGCIFYVTTYINFDTMQSVVLCSNTSEV